jgi:hypothetical protein
MIIRYFKILQYQYYKRIWFKPINILLWYKNMTKAIEGFIFNGLAFYRVVEKTDILFFNSDHYFY